MITLSRRSYRILTWLMPVFIVFAARDLLWLPLESIFSHFANIRLLSNQIRSTGVHIRALPEMRSDYEKLARKKAAIASSLFGAQSEAGLYDLLMLKAREAEVSIVSAVPRPRRSGEGFAEQPLSIEAAGPYAGIIRFVSNIENVSRLMRVEGIHMTKDRAGRLSSDIRLFVYLYSDTLSDSRKAAKGNRHETVYQDRQDYLADLNAALNVTIAEPVQHAYDTAALKRRGDPFGASPAPPIKKPAAVSVSGKSLGLTLKGILWKEPPLAILESLDGRTYIVKQGDSIHGFTVSSIKRSEVAITTPQGDHILHQYEQK